MVVFSSFDTERLMEIFSTDRLKNVVGDDKGSADVANTFVNDKIK